MMNKRLVWNFEIDISDSLQIETEALDESTEMTWESRFFWHADEIIVLHGLSQAFLDLSHYQIKHKADEYYLLPDQPYNLKVRRNRLYYKPLVIKTPHIVAYGKKLDLREQKPDMLLVGTDEIDVKTMLAQIKQYHRRILVEKETLNYQFHTSPPTHLELAKINIAKTIYFSVCVESSSRILVESLTAQLLPHSTINDYVSFLQHAIIL